MPTPTGYWTKSEIEGQHVFSYRLCRWIADFLPKDQPVIDLGCGLGDYLRLLKDLGFQDLTGVEGEDHEQFQYEENVFLHDLTQPLDLGKQGNVICLEVAEHIPAEYTDQFLDNVFGHVADGGKLILSWAVPGQAGYGHVNCKHNIWVIEEMQRLGFSLLVNETFQARSVIEQYCNWFCNTLLIFTK